VIFLIIFFCIFFKSKNKEKTLLHGLHFTGTTKKRKEEYSINYLRNLILVDKLTMVGTRNYEQ
jgi:hypothetical protein